jgi:hypothetical protein
MIQPTGWLVWIATDQMLISVGVPHLCQNKRKSAVISGHPRARRMTSNLGTSKLTPCLKRPSKLVVKRECIELASVN